ncbi:hypothetical protein IKW72_05920 [bacterium]|nr:hypothetical protein [bacterium]
MKSRPVFFPILLILLSVSCLALKAEEVLWPVYGKYSLTGVRDLTVALGNDQRVNLWSAIRRVANGGTEGVDKRVEPVLFTEKKIASLWACTLLGLKNKDVYKIREAVTGYRELRGGYPAFMPQRRCFATLSKIHAALRSSLEPLERREADDWLVALSSRREPDVDDKAAEALGAAYKVFAGVAVGRMDVSTQGKLGMKKFLLSLNKEAVPTAMEVGVSHSLLENYCLAAEVFAGSSDDLFKMAARFSKGEDLVIKAWALKLAELKDSSDVLPGRGWEKDALFSPAAAFILACRCNVALSDLEKAANVDPCLAAFYYTRTAQASRIAGEPLITSPAGTGWLVARSRVQKGPEARYLRLISVSGGRYGDLLSLLYNGGGRTLMGRKSQQDGGSLIGREYFTHTVSSSTVTIDHKKQKAAAARVLCAENRQGLTFLDLDGSQAYEKMDVYRRTLFMCDDYCIDIFSLASKEPFIAEWVMETEKDRPLVLKGTTAPEMSYEIKDIAKSFLGSAWREQAYHTLEDVSSQLAAAQWSCDFGNGAKTTMLGQSDTRVMTANAGGALLKTGDITHYRKTDQSLLIARRQNVKETRFAALHEIYGEAPKTKSFMRLEVTGDALVFEISYGDYLDYVVVNFGKEPLSFNISENKIIKANASPYAFLRLHREQEILLQDLNAELVIEKD